MWRWLAGLATCTRTDRLACAFSNGDLLQPGCIEDHDAAPRAEPNHFILPQPTQDFYNDLAYRPQFLSESGLCHA
jgi:hypothetical protein